MGLVFLLYALEHYLLEGIMQANQIEGNKEFFFRNTLVPVGQSLELLKSKVASMFSPEDYRLLQAVLQDLTKTSG